jgi:RNA polymerase sigma-70 factor (ECF subfamily)
MSLPNRSNDTAVLEQARAGDMDAFNRLILAHERRVYSLTYRTLGNAEDAADATQETFINAFRAIRTFRGEDILPWLLRIAVRCCYDQLRRRKRRREDSLGGETEDTSQNFPTAPELGPEHSAMRAETASAIEQALQLLSDEQRMIVTLCDVIGLTYEEAASAAGLELGTVKSRLSRARARLRDLLRARGELPGAPERLI